MYIERRIDSPFFSVCIPQYNRTSFLIDVLKSLDGQTYRNFEVCISDDCSTDGRQAELLKYLESSNLAYCYQRQQRNLRYDGNIRAAMYLGEGEYLFLLGNDDVIATPHIFENLVNQINQWQQVGVVFTNYADSATKIPYARVNATAIIGTGPSVAVHQYRNFSFVSGVILQRKTAQEIASTKWDGSEMYQTYIGCRMIASGLYAATIDLITVFKDVQIEGEAVDSYVTLTQKNPNLTKARHIPLTQLARVVADAIQPYVSKKEAYRLYERIVTYLYIFPYAFWLVEYRRIQSWIFALNIAIGMRPTVVARDIPLSVWRRLRLYLVYMGITFIGLLLPTSLFQKIRSTLHQVAKRVRL